MTKGYFREGGPSVFHHSIQQSSINEMHEQGRELLAACKALMQLGIPPIGKPGHISYADAVVLAEKAIARATKSD